MTVSRETTQAMTAYVDAIASWNERISMVGPGQMAGLMHRAVEDAEALDRLMPDGAVSNWVDLGSGAGLPAIPLAIRRRPIADGLTLVDSDRRKAAFLRHALRVACLVGKVLVGRIERIEPLDASVITARALAPLDVLAGYASRHLAPGGRLLALKGRNVGLELDEMHRRWTADVEVHTNAGETVIIEMSSIERRSSEGRNDA